MHTQTMDGIEICQNENGTWYGYDVLNQIVIKDEFRTEKEAYDYARWEYITKPCFNGLVYKQLTRAQFVRQWMEYSAELMPLFLRANSSSYLDMQLAVEEGAGRMWDSI